MNKALLLEKYIKVAVKKALKEQEEQQERSEKAMYFIHRFPGLKKTLEGLLSPSFGRYVANISLVSPKPTTFNIELINSQDFSIYYIGKGNFTVKVAGKRYNPVNLGELERASQAITDLLELRYAPLESKEATASQYDADLKQDVEGPKAPTPSSSIPTNPSLADTGETPEAPEEPETPEEEEIPAV